MSDFLNQYRAKNPSYNDLDDSQLATALHAKYNADTGANLAVEDFNAAIGLVSEPAADTPPLDLRAVPTVDAAPMIPQEQPQFDAITGRAPEEKSILELVSEKIGNWGAGAVERSGDIGGALLRTAQVAGELIESKTRLGGLVYDDGDLSYYSADEYEKINPPTIASKGADVLQGLDLGYEEKSNWEGVKQAFQEGGPLSGSAYAEVLEYGIEQGVKSIPDMVGAMFSMPAYIVARSGEIGDERAKNKGKEKTELVDILEAAPAATASALLERIGAKGMTSGAKEVLGKEMLKAGLKESAKRVAKAGGKALSKEAATEAIQEGMIEYVGERFGTDKAMVFGEALDRALGAAVAGGVFGGTVSGATTTGAEINYNPEKLLGKELAKGVEKAELPSAEAAARAALSPDKSQMEVVKEPAVDLVEKAQAEKAADSVGRFDPAAEGAKAGKAGLATPKDLTQAIDEDVTTGERKPLKTRAPEKQEAPVVEPVAEERKTARILTDEELEYLPAPEALSGVEAGALIRDANDKIISRAPSTAPGWFKSNPEGYTVAEASKILAKARDRKPLTEKQAGFVDRAITMTRQDAQGAPIETVNTIDLDKGDKFTISGEEYTVKSQEGSDLVLKNGEVFKVSSFDGSIDIDPGSLETSTEQPKRQTTDEMAQDIAVEKAKKEEGGVQQDIFEGEKLVGKTPQKGAGDLPVFGGAPVSTDIEKVRREKEFKEAQGKLLVEPKAPTKPKEPAAPAPKVDTANYGTEPVKAYNTFNKKVGAQTATAEEIKADADNVVKNKDSIIATFSQRKFTKTVLQQIIRSPRSDWTKPQMVKQAYEQLLQNHIMADSVVLEFMGTKTIEEQYIDVINKQTQENVDAAYERQREERAKRLKFKEDTQKALDNPETLIEFTTFIRTRGKSKLTAEQLATYDELVAETMREEDKPKTVKGEAATISTTRAQTVHSKTGEDLFIVKMVERVERDKFTELKRKAKEFGGWYSTFSKAGAIPGWQFKTLEAADQFEELLAGKDVDKSDFTEAKAEVKQSANAQKLLDMAASMEEKATEELSRDRLANTSKRAGQAATAISRAQGSIAFAKTIRKIAVRLQGGDIVHLGKISQATQLEQLQTIQREAIPLDLYDRGPNLDYKELKAGVTIDDYIAKVEMPELGTYGINFLRDLADKKGFMRLANELTRVRKNRNNFYPLTEQQISKIKEAKKAGHVSQYDSGVTRAIESQQDVNRLKKLGITSDEQLRAAIRELDSLTVEKQKEDPVKKLERDLVGKKIAGYFPTPKELVNTMLDYADIQEGHEVLEPSAGKGNIAAEIMADAPNAILEVLEIDSGLRSILEAKGYNVVGNDFLDHKKKYDRIVMNPPFESFQDIDHVKHAYDLLKPGGKLVAIMGAGVKNSRAKAVDFRQWLDDKGSYIEDNPDGSFKSSERPTGVSTVMVTVDKNDTNTTDYKKADTKKTPEQQGPKVFNAPGHNYVGLHRSMGIPPRKDLMSVGGKNIKMPKNPQRIEPIRRMITKIAGRRIYYAKIKGKSREGFYRPSTGEIRTRRKNDVEVLAHELAHYLDSYSNVTLPNFKKLYREKQYEAEVNGLSYTDADKQVQKIEGFAEFVRLWLTNEVEAQRRAPSFYTAFNEQVLRDKKLAPKMLKTQELMHKFYFQGPDKLGQALIGQSQSFRQTFEEWAYRRDSLIRQQVIDRFHAARLIEMELTGKIGKVKESAWKQLRISNGGAEGIADFILNFGTVQFDAAGDLKRNGKSLRAVLMPLRKIKLKPEHRGVKRIDLIMRYFAGRRALELHRQGRENLIPKETAMEWARLGGQYEVFETIHKDYQAFNGRMMDFYEEAGMITPEGREIMQTMNQDYVPFNRIRDSLTGGKGAGGGFHKLKGGTANLNDILINIQDGITANVRAALNNRAKQRLYGYISGHKDGAIFATRISPDSKKVGVYEEEMRAKIEKVLIENGIMDEDGVYMTSAGTAIDKDNMLIEGKELLTFWQHGVKPQLNESGNVVDQVIINGKPRYYEVQDPLLQDMLLSMNPESYSSFMNIMFGFKNFFTRMITLGVEFTGANLVRDTAGSAVLSKNKFKPFYDSFKGMYSFIAKDEHYKAFIRSGGGHSSRIEGMTTAGKARRRVKLQEFGVMTATQQLLTNIDNIMSAFEYGTRIGEFRMAKKNSASDMDAGFQAREISTDFSVTGSNRFITGAIRTVPFLNAMIQSQDRMYREMIVGKKYDGNPLGVAMKGFLGVTIPTLILYMINRDDEDYQQIPDWEKRTNWHIKVGKDEFVKIPRPYDIGFAYATMPELFFKYVEDDKGREFADGLMWTLTQMYGVDATPAMMQGWWDIVRNEKWTGAPVVPRSLENVEATEQYTSNTSETFIRMGQALGVSPIEAEHLFKAYTGYLGGYLMAATDHMLWDEEKFGDKPDAKLSDNIFIKRFLTSEVRHSTAFMEKFFDLKEKSDKVVATFKQTVDTRRLLAEKGESAGKFRDDRFFGLSAEEKKVLFGLNDSMNQIIKAIYGREGLKTAEIKIKLDKNLSGAEKRIKLDGLWKVRNKAFMDYYNKAESALEKAREKGPKNED